MYVPSPFIEDHPQRIAALVEANPFGMLITAPDGAPAVSHLPFLLEKSAHGGMTLWGHVAKANPQWRHLSPDAEVLVVFCGPHAYISPTWYCSPGVPTWNYAVAHLHGLPRVITGEAELADLVQRLTEKFESVQPQPWRPNLSDETRRSLLAMIVGFEIQITRAQGKFKLSQNRSAEDQRRVAAELAQSRDATAVALSKLMQPPAPADE